MPALELADIPVQRLDEPEIVDRLVEASSTVGFVQLVGFEDPSIFDDAFALSRDFFSLPDADKERLATRTWRPENENVYRGYFPAIEGAHAYKEGFEIGNPDFEPPVEGHPLFEANPYPAALGPPWRRSLDRYAREMHRLGRRVLAAFEQGFELPAGKLTGRFANSMSTLRMIHYPQGADPDPARAAESGGHARAAESGGHARAAESGGHARAAESGEPGPARFATPEHVDSGILTLLLQDDTGGLQVKGPDGAWLDVVPRENTLVMNLGALLETLTGGRLKATEHRVLLPGRSRYSMPFFFEPSPDAAMTDLFTGRNDVGVPDYEHYLVEQMKVFVEYRDLVERLRAGEVNA
ncbi:MAG: 2OG-Fe(II) oxygenase family protein [Actinomycetota bacterium]|nr:2OG-Fe(II) oxygenase family protein [Actinomycetota bacterium]